MNLPKAKKSSVSKKRGGSGANRKTLSDQNLEVEKIRKETGISAIARKIDGQIVLDDPQALAFFHVRDKQKCGETLKLNAQRVEYFKSQLTKKGLTAKDAVIVLLNVDDEHGGPLADALLPGFNWQKIRDSGEIPCARGFAARKDIQKIIELFDKEAANKLKKMKGVAVVVVDYGVAEVFAA